MKLNLKWNAGNSQKQQKKPVIASAIGVGGGSSSSAATGAAAAGGGVVSSSRVFGGSEENEEEEEALLVIPLPPPRQATATTTAATVGAMSSKKRKADEICNVATDSLDSQAAAELIKEMKTDRSQTPSSSLTIELGEARTAGSLPLLQANLAPELLAVRDESERFKLDVAMKANDVNFSSDTFRKVPVEQFGAAMLRGMGWTGPSAEDEEYSKRLNKAKSSRIVRLGLGALAKPPELSDRKVGTKEQREEISKEWQKKLEAKLASQKFSEGDLVWIRNPLHVGRRAKVVAVRGVPGLDQIRIKFETDGVEISIKRTDVMLITPEELTKTPYREP